MNTNLISTFSLLLPQSLSYSSDTTSMLEYPENTERLVDAVQPGAELGDEICFNLKEGGLITCLGDRFIEIQISHPKLLSQGNWERSPMTPLRDAAWGETGQWRVEGLELEVMLRFSPALTLDLDIFTEEDDGHRYLMHGALVAVDGSLLDALGMHLDELQSSLPPLVSQRDFPPYPLVSQGTYLDLISCQFRPGESRDRHALKGVVFDPADGKVRLATEAEHRKSIRNTIAGHLDQVRDLGLRLRSDKKTLRDASKLESFVDTVRGMESSLESGDLPTVVRGIKEYREELYFAQTRDIVFPNNDSDSYDNTKMLELLMLNYTQMANMAETALEEFQRADAFDDSDARARGVQAYRNLLVFFQDEARGALAKGLGPDEAMWQMTLAAGLHLVQDSVAHCDKWKMLPGNLWTGKCEGYVSVNIFGLGTIHGSDHDKVKDEEGHELDTASFSKYLSTEFIEIALMPHSQEYELRRESFLNIFAPEGLPLPHLVNQESRLPEDDKVHTQSIR